MYSSAATGQPCAIHSGSSNARCATRGGPRHLVKDLSGASFFPRRGEPDAHVSPDRVWVAVRRRRHEAGDRRVAGPAD